MSSSDNTKDLIDIMAIFPKIIQELKQELKTAKTEEDVKMRIGPFLDKMATRLGLEMAKYEHRLEISGGRPDALYQKVIVEYKSPGSLNELTFHKAVNQVINYIEDLSKQSGLNKSFYYSAIIDGIKIAFVRYSEVEEKWIKVRPQELDEINMSRLLNAMRGLRRKELTAENIVKDFGPESDLARKIISAFYMTEMKSPRALILQDEWFETFKQIVSYKSKSMGELAKYYQINAVKEEEFKKLLFSVQTYFALLMKLIVAEVMSNYSKGKFSGSYLLQLKETENIKDELKELENEGGFFQKIMQLKNFLEGNYFSWYIDEWNDEIEKAIKNMIDILTEYESATADLKPERIRDLFKTLYQDLIPDKLRHDFGEYYTPDWLAELLIREAGILKDDKIIEKRFLDPACGSGTFLVNIIKHFKIKLEEESLDRRVIASKILENIVGFDLNPIAVLSSRANFIIAMGDLIRERKGEVEIPVYLSDSVGLKVHFDLKGGGTKYYVLRSVVGEFKVPDTLIQSDKLAISLDIAKRSLEFDETVENFIKGIKQKLINLNDNEIEHIEEIYKKLLELEHEGKNKIWVGLLKNTFAPILKGKFDYVIGNPPWINWENLPEDYREETKDLWDNYKLISNEDKKTDKRGEVELGSPPEKSTSGRLGKVKRDLSMLFIAVSIEKYLSDNGTLAMLCPFTLFKVTAGNGFRYVLAKKDNPPRKIIKIIDLVEMKPFQGSTTRTSALILKKGSKTKFPVDAELWRPKEPIKMNYNLEEVMDKSEIYKLKFFPLSEDDVRRPWFMLNEKAMIGLRKAIGKSDYNAHAGVNTGLNGAYWVEILEKKDNLVFVRNLYNIGKIKVPKVEAWVEEDLVYPLVRGRDIQDFLTATPSVYIILPINKENNILTEEEAKNRYEYAFSYFNKLKYYLLKRNGQPYKSWFNNNVEIPFYTIFNIKNSLTKYKVAWSYISGEISGKAELKVGLIEPNKKDGKIQIPNEKCMFIPTNDYDESMYLLGILNSSIAKLIVASYSIETHIAPDIMNVIKIIRYDQNNEKHRDIVKLVKKIRDEKTSKKDNSDLLLELDKLVAGLYGISDDELEEIKNDLILLLNIFKEEIKENEEMEENLEE